MKTIQLTTKDRLISSLILYANESPYAVGLLTGKMGLVLVITKYARMEGCSQFEASADFLYEEMRKGITQTTDIGFASGLSGICWGVEYLVQNEIMPGPADEICADTDQKIMQTNIKRITDFTLENGLTGLWHYVWARIQGNMLAELPLPFDEQYLTDWLEIIESNPERFPKDAAHRLRSAMTGTLIPDPLDFKQFVKPMDSEPDRNLSLADGLAGYITLKYLN